MNEDVVGARGKQLLYSKRLGGIIHRDFTKDLVEFGDNCARMGIHMNYDGKKKDCGWSIALKQTNEITRTLSPFALASGMDGIVFIKDVVGEFLENFKVECIKTDFVKELGSFRKDAISKTVFNVNNK